MQSHQAELFKNLGEKNFTRYESINSPRGNIVDSLGNFLATNKPVYSLYWQGTGNRTLSDAQQDIINKLEALNIKVSDIKQIAKSERQKKLYLINQNVPFDLVQKISEQFIGSKNICLKKDWMRYYPYGSSASHIIGYLGNLGGKMGLEYLYNSELKGSYGSLVKIINSFGCQLDSYEIKQAAIGQSIETTLDINIQKIAEDLFPENYSGACLVFNPYTGALEAVVSKPNFDPEIFLKPINYDTWHALQDKKCFINRAFNACYPPASIYKLVTLSAALENNLVKLDDIWTCKGHIKFCGRLYYCQRRRGHGQLSTREAIAYSCNIPFYEIGKTLPIDTLADYAKRLGLGVKTDNIFTEQSGLVPSSSWKLSTKKERWYLGETLSTVIGQSFLLVTPVQIARMMGGFCTGYLTSPRILAVQPINREKVNLEVSTILDIRKAMRGSVVFGSAKNLKNLPDFKIWAKTGTAQTRKLTYGDKTSSHAWLGSFFKYKKHEPRVLVVLIESAGSSRVATEYAYKFFKEYKKYLDSSKQNLQNS